MNDKTIKEMWEIDSKAIFGDPISVEQKKFFNDNLLAMKQEMTDNYNHWLEVEEFKL